jgi:hypothetical protein
VKWTKAKSDSSFWFNFVGFNSIVMIVPFILTVLSRTRKEWDENIEYCCDQRNDGISFRLLNTSGSYHSRR